MRAVFAAHQRAQAQQREELASMFSLSHEECFLDDFNPRAEVHGKERKPAADLKLSFRMGQERLEMFDAELRAALYCKRNKPDADMVEQASDAPNLRFPKLKTPVRWTLELVGALCTIHYGASGAGDFELAGVAVKDFELTPQEGGTVLVAFKVQGHPDETACGKLSVMIQKPCEISIEPAKVPVQQSLPTMTPAERVGADEQARVKAKAAAEAAFESEPIEEPTTVEQAAE